MTTVSERYIHAVNGQDLAAMKEILHPQVVMEHPIGTFEGLEATLGFFEDVVFPMATKMELRGPVMRSEEVEMFRAVALPTAIAEDEPEPQYVVDVFEIAGDGRVRSIEVYLRHF